MKRKFIALLLVMMTVLIFFCSGSFAAERDSISVNGHASAEVAPDMATLYGNLEKRAAVAEAARESLTKDMASFRHMLLGQMIAGQDVQTVRYTLQPEYSYEKNKRRLTGYIARADYKVKIKDLEKLGAKFAYTIDGDHLGWYQDQTFNAAEAIVTITGRSVHPATAKGIMVNASDLAAEFLTALPSKEKPQFTDGVEGFYYVTSLQSDCEHGEIRMIIRDFDRQNFRARQDRLLEIARGINEACGQERVRVEINQQYRNMGDVLEQYPFLVADLEAAIRAAGLEPKSEPFRGGTDGSALSFRGLPSPNLSAGYENAHGRFEFVPVPSMAKNVEILIHLTEK